MHMRDKLTLVGICLNLLVNASIDGWNDILECKLRSLHGFILQELRYSSDSSRRRDFILHSIWSPLYNSDSRSLAVPPYIPETVTLTQNDYCQCFFHRTCPLKCGPDSSFIHFNPHIWCCFRPSSWILRTF